MSSINAETVTLQPASPDEPELAAELIFATEPHIFGYLHGHDMALVRSHLGHQWQQPDSLFSHRYGTAAMHGGRLAGIEIGYGRAEQERAAVAMIEHAMAHMTAAQFAHMATWLEYGPYVLPPVPEDAWYLQHLAVVAEARGKGVGERLLRHALERSREAGFARVLLDIYEENPARRLYQRMGFEVIVETLVKPLVERGIPKHLRMECRLHS